MSEELIRKSEVLDLINASNLNLLDYKIYSELFDSVDGMQPVTAVERKPQLRCENGGNRK